MAAPTVVLQQLASANTSTGGTNFTRAFTAVSVVAGDVLAINMRTEDGAFHATSVANAGTATVSAWTRVQTTGAAGSKCANDLFTATVSGSGTLTATVTVTVSGGSTCRNGGTLLVATGALATNTTLSATARQLSITPASTNSFIATFTTDWTAAASNGATFVPAGQGQVIDIRATDGVDQQASAGANSSVFCAHWTDTAGAGATTYGLSSPSAGAYNLTAVEFTGTAGGAAYPFELLTHTPRAY